MLRMIDTRPVIGAAHARQRDAVAPARARRPFRPRRIHHGVAMMSLLGGLWGFCGSLGGLVPPVGMARAAPAASATEGAEGGQAASPGAGAPAAAADSAATRRGRVLARSSVPAPAAPSVPGQACDWPQLNRFFNTVVQADGRVIDYTPPVKTTSEGQAYAMFFALVNNDRPAFDRLLQWTQQNLAGGDLRARLPAWQWGARKDGSYGVIDQNSASDADLWLAYDLSEAGRLWREKAYSALARSLLDQIADREVFALPGLGRMLAPGENGFAVASDLWRLNPSYVPMPLLRAAARVDAQGPWNEIAANTLKMVKTTAPKGFSPDWTAYQAGKGFVVDPVNGDLGSYDAIRVYLWAGMTAKGDALAQPMLAALPGMASAIEHSGAPPEKVATLSGVGSGTAPSGFSAALLPYLKARGAAALLKTQQDAVNAALLRAAPNYYDSVLLLFGTGFAEGRFAFDAAGRLQPRWGAACHAQ